MEPCSVAINIPTASNFARAGFAGSAASELDSMPERQTSLTRKLPNLDHCDATLRTFSDGQNCSTTSCSIGRLPHQRAYTGRVSIQGDGPTGVAGIRQGDLPFDAKLDGRSELHERPALQRNAKGVASRPWRSSRICSCGKYAITSGPCERPAEPCRAVSEIPSQHGLELRVFDHWEHNDLVHAVGARQPCCN